MSLDGRRGIIMLAIPDVLLLSADRLLVAGLRLAALSLSSVDRLTRTVADYAEKLTNIHEQ